MGINREQAQIDVITNMGSSINELSKLEGKLSKLSEAYRDLGKTTKKNREEKTALKGEMLKAQQAITAEREALGPLAQSYNQLQRSLNNIKKERAQLSPITGDYTRKLAALVEKEKAYSEEMKKRQAMLNPAKSWFKQISEQMPAAVAGAVGGMTVGLAGTLLDKAASFINDKITRMAETGKAISGLSAITGVKDAETLRYYGQQAGFLGQQFGLAGKDIVKAFQLVGSIKPELLSMKEALVDVTEQAIILAKASGDILSVEDAARAVVGSLNQFGEGADQAARFANVLAAGAKEGSSEINQTAAAFKYFGAVAKVNNLTFEQSNALVQVLASKMIMGEQAGTNLRNIFTKLMIGASEFNPTVVGLNKALDNLARLNPSQLVAKFGDENITAATTVIGLRKEVETLTTKITGTNEAVEQQRTQMGNLSGDIDRLSSAWNGFFTSGGKESEGFFRKVTQGLTGLIKGFGVLFKYINFDMGGSEVGKQSFLGFSLDLDKYEQDTAAEYERKDKKNIATNARSTVSAVVGERMKHSSGDENAARIQATKETVVQMRKAYLDLQAEYGRTTDSMQKQVLRNMMKQAGANLATAKNEADRLIKNEKDRSALLVKLKEQEEEKKGDAAEKAANKAAAAHEKAKRLAEQQAREEIQNQFKLAETYTRLIEDKQVREEQQAQLKYARALNEATQAGAQQHALEVAAKLELEHELAEIEKRFEQKRLERAEKMAHNLAKAGLKTAVFAAQEKRNQIGTPENKDEAFQAYSADLDVLNARKSLDLAMLASDEKLALIRAEEEEKEAIREEFRLRNLELEQQFASEEAKIGEGYFDTLSALGKKREEEEAQSRERAKQREQEAMQFVANAAQQLVSSIASIRNSGFQRQEKQEEKAKNNSLRRLEQQKEQGLISEGQFSQAKTRIEEQAAEKIAQIRRRQAIADRAASITQVAISGILAAMQAYAQAGPFGGTIGAVIMGVITAANIAAIAAQPLPEYAVGGRPDEEQLAIVGEEGVEQISPNWQMNDPTTRPYLDWLEQRRQGNITGNQGPPPPNATAPSGAGAGAAPAPVYAPSDGRIAESLDKLNETIKDGIEAKLDYRHLKRTDKRIERNRAESFAPAD